jgi:hypothetical protein
MDLGMTLAVAAGAAALAALFGWLGARPADPIRGVRMVPWRFLMCLAAAVVLIMLVHLANLMGVKTGR